jgi:hypothetical protein
MELLHAHAHRVCFCAGFGRPSRYRPNTIRNDLGRS